MAIDPLSRPQMLLGKAFSLFFQFFFLTEIVQEHRQYLLGHDFFVATETDKFFLAERCHYNFGGATTQRI
jgi:hypothetical protein